MMKQVVKFGALAFVLVIACSVHTGKGAVIKDAQAKNKLAQELNCPCTNMQMNFNDVPLGNKLPSVSATRLQSGNTPALGAGTL